MNIPELACMLLSRYVCMHSAVVGTHAETVTLEYMTTIGKF